MNLSIAESVRGDAVGRDLTLGRSTAYATVGAATVVAVVAVVARYEAEPVIGGLLAIVVLCYGLLSIVDAAEQRLPNRITVPLAAATIAAVAIGGFARGDIGASLRALAVGATFAIVLVVLRFGMGDVKLALTVGTIAGWLGSDAVMVTAYVGASAGAAMALLLIIIHRRRNLSFSFGPFLAIGSVAGMLTAVP